jgi:cysteinyl-tRNA synthetase
VRIYRTLERLEERVGPVAEKERGGQGSLPDSPEGPFMASFQAVMDDDLNTAGAVGLLFEKVKDINRRMDASTEDTATTDRQLVEEREGLLAAAGILGLLGHRPAEFFNELSREGDTPDPAEIERLVAERTDARSGKDWSRADAIRDELHAQGVVLEDGPQGTTWRFELR